MSTEHSSSIRVRFAPSPTGHLHIGSLRTALFNVLFARSKKGTFLMRIEDTDRERSRLEYTESIFQTLAWIGITVDEPVVIQTERLAEHQKVITQLLAEKKAYHCFCLTDDVRQRTGAAEEYMQYDGKCRDREVTEDDLAHPHVVRFKTPRDQESISFVDMIRGIVTFEMKQIDDFIIARSDGNPMYNFVVVVDDAFMDITHVIRGEDHIANTPKQVLLYEACGYRTPYFAHLPLILGPNGNRLSKRDAATSALEYQREGYLPQALINYLARLGWSHGDQEIFSMDEMIQYFSIEQIGHKGSMFGVDKLNWINSVYIKAMADDALLDYITTYVDETLVADLSNWSRATVVALLGLYKERFPTLRQLAIALRELHMAPQEYEPESYAKWMTPDTAAHLRRVIAVLQEPPLFDEQTVTGLGQELCKELGVKLGVIAQPIRIALTGSSASPGVWPLVALLGRKEATVRLQNLLQRIEQS